MKLIEGFHASLGSLLNIVPQDSRYSILCRHIVLKFVKYLFCFLSGTQMCFFINWLCSSDNFDKNNAISKAIKKMLLVVTVG